MSPEERLGLVPRAECPGEAPRGEVLRRESCAAATDATELAAAATELAAAASTRERRMATGEDAELLGWESSLSVAEPSSTLPASMCERVKSNGAALAAAAGGATSHTSEVMLNGPPTCTTTS